MSIVAEVIFNNDVKIINIEVNSFEKFKKSIKKKFRLSENFEVELFEPHFNVWATVDKTNYKNVPDGGRLRLKIAIRSSRKTEQKTVLVNCNDENKKMVFKTQSLRRVKSEIVTKFNIPIEEYRLEIFDQDLNEWVTLEKSKDIVNKSKLRVVKSPLSTPTQSITEQERKSQPNTPMKIDVKTEVKTEGKTEGKMENVDDKEFRSEPGPSDNPHVEPEFPKKEVVVVKKEEVVVNTNDFADFYTETPLADSNSCQQPPLILFDKSTNLTTDQTMLLKYEGELTSATAVVVTLIGRTKAGKSTLINKFLPPYVCSKPAVAQPKQPEPTTGDMHLYHGPFGNCGSVIFMDAEGEGGSENCPPKHAFFIKKNGGS